MGEREGKKKEEGEAKTEGKISAKRKKSKGKGLQSDGPPGSLKLALLTFFIRGCLPEC